MKIRCKFVCSEVKEIAASPNQFSAKFQAVHEGSEDNKKFFLFTPSGSLELQTVKESNFKAGAEYYIDITPAA